MDINRKGNVIYDPCGRWLYLFDNINKETAKQFAKFLTETQISAHDWSRPVTILIDSCGGDGVASLLIYRMLTNFLSPITTIAVKKACSGAFTIFEAGKQRIMLPEAKLKFHWAAWYTSKDDYLNIEDLDYVRKKILCLNNCFYQIFSLRSRQKMANIKKFFREELIFAPNEAKKYNLADKIIPRKKIPELPTVAYLNRVLQKTNTKIKNVKSIDFNGNSFLHYISCTSSTDKSLVTDVRGIDFSCIGNTGFV